MVAVMSTLPAATLIVTSDRSSMPAAEATFCCKLEVSKKSLTLPLAVSVSTTVSVEGRVGVAGGGGTGGEDGGGLGFGGGAGGHGGLGGLAANMTGVCHSAA